MPVTIVVGGQFGSEGKGKVAHFLAREMGAAVAIRVGGPNSGHTVVNDRGERFIFRQLPTAAILPGVVCALAAGSYLDLEVVLSEIKLSGLSSARLAIDPQAVLISEADKQQEHEMQLRERLGSTLSGTGAAVQRRVSRNEGVLFAKDEPRLRDYIQPVRSVLREQLGKGERVIVEGTQGFGLSLLHGAYPKVTSRDTTAAGFLAEVGMSPLDVDDVVLVIRAFPIRVPGNSGELPSEIDWVTVTLESGSKVPIVELTSVTRSIRRVSRFDPTIVREAVAVNRPTRIVLNHLDYIDSMVAGLGAVTEKVIRFVAAVEDSIAKYIDYWGLSPSVLIPSLTKIGMRSRFRVASRLG